MTRFWCLPTPIGSGAFEFHYDVYPAPGIALMEVYVTNSSCLLPTRMDSFFPLETLSNLLCLPYNEWY